MKSILREHYFVKLLALVILVLAFGCKNEYSSENDFVGSYEGEFTHGNFSTPIQISIEKDSLDYNVYFTSPDQNAYRIPTSNVQYIKDSISFELNSDYYSFKFKNKLSENGTALNARLTVDTIAQNFNLTRKEDVADSGFRREEVRFESDGLVLSGTIFYPDTTSNKALYFVSSSGNSDRSASRAEAINFAKRGYITFHMDKRGTGTSEGDWRSASIEELAADDMNAINFLASKLDVPLSRIGIKGSSQGGAKVPYILSQMEALAYGIVVSCPSTSLLESDLNYWKNTNQPLIEAQYFGEALALERLVYEYIGGLTTPETLENGIARHRNKPWFSQVWIPNLNELEIDPKLQFSPMPYFKKINQPVLIIQGTKDEIIPEESSAEIFKVLKDPVKAKVVLLENANHSVQLVDNSDFPYWPMPHPEYLPTIITWLDSL